MPTNNQLDRFLNNPKNFYRIDDLNTKTTSANDTSDVHNMVDRVSHKTHKAIDDVSNKAHDVKVQVSDTAHDVKAKTEAKINHIASDVHHEYVNFDTDFANHNITIRNHSYDYTTLSTGLAFATSGLSYAVEEGLATVADLYRSVSSLYNGEFRNTAGHVFDAVTHAATGSAALIFNSFITQSSGNADVANIINNNLDYDVNSKDIENIMYYSKIAGSAIGVIGAGQVGYDVLYHDENI